jgi:hypothetical protein
MPSKPLGLSPVDLQTLYVTLGAGHPITYAETGWMVSTNLGKKVKEQDYRPRFLSMCSRGLVTFKDWKQLGMDIRARIIIDIPKGTDVIRDIQIYLGGDFSYYKYFDPYVNYEQNPEKMDRFLKGPMTIDSTPRQIEKKKLFEAQHKAHMADPKNNRW